MGVPSSAAVEQWACRGRDEANRQARQGKERFL
jgi:hypothetical protein